MPEGDTVHRVARILGRELAGRAVDRVELHDRGEISSLEGRCVERVEAVGKHMLVYFDGGTVLRVHLGMKGSWRRQHVAEARRGAPTVTLVAGTTVYLCQGAYRAEVMDAAAVRAHPRLARLGPDLLADPPPLDEALRRARLPGHAGREIGDLVLDQRVASGIGNIYKSEVLFECRVHPRTAVRDLTDDALHGIFAKAAHLMRLGLLIRRRSSAPVRRRSTPSSRRYWVYLREGRPCLDCGTPVRRILQGDMGRSTYFCPTCQPAERP
jgi:endonuclease-8